MWAPSKIPAGTICTEIASTMDMLPTIAKLAGGKVPTDRVIDGHDISNLVHGVEDATGATDAFYYYVRTQLRAVRSGPWKLHLPLKSDQFWGRYSKPEDVIDISIPLLYNLESDIGESKDVASKYPGVVKKLLQLAEHARSDIGDIDKIGENARFFDKGTRRPDIQSASSN
jgi:arylsulfatase A-like enzyme